MKLTWPYAQGTASHARQLREAAWVLEARFGVLPGPEWPQDKAAAEHLKKRANELYRQAEEEESRLVAEHGAYGAAGW